MNTQKRVLKVLIVIILAIFLLSTGLVSVMYLVDTKSTGDLSGSVADSGSLSASGGVATGTHLLSGTK